MLVCEESGIFRDAGKGLGAEGQFGSESRTGRLASRHEFILASQQFAVVRACRAQSPLEFGDAGLITYLINADASLVIILDITWAG